VHPSTNGAARALFCSWGGLTMMGMGLGGPERRGGDVFSVYFNVIEQRRTCCFVWPLNQLSPLFHPSYPSYPFIILSSHPHSLLKSRGPLIDEPLVFVARR
jgi:hypothetical protein